MGIFDYFKKILESKKVEEVEKEKIAFSEIEGWIDKKRKHLRFGSPRPELAPDIPTIPQFGAHWRNSTLSTQK